MSEKEYHDDVVIPARQPVQTTNALKGLISNPYVFATALFASIGGVTFGCKSFVITFYIQIACTHSLSCK